VKLLLNSSHLEPQAVKPQCHHRFQRNTKPPLPGVPNVKVVL
jgi:hypothetical protein